MPKIIKLKKYPTKEDVPKDYKSLDLGYPATVGNVRKALKKYPDDVRVEFDGTNFWVLVAIEEEVARVEREFQEAMDKYDQWYAENKEDIEYTQRQRDEKRKPILEEQLAAAEMKAKELRQRLERLEG